MEYLKNGCKIKILKRKTIFAIVFLEYATRL